MLIEIIIYKDRLEIKNPGGLYGRLTIDKLGKIQPDTRNPVLASAMGTPGLTENIYSGILTIRREMALAGMKAPDFKDSRNEFMVIFYNNEIHRDEEYKREEQSLLELCKIPRSRQEISEF